MRIAFFGNSWNDENFDNFVMGLRDVLGDNADVFVFSSAASFSQSSALIEAENSILFMPDYSFFDVAIVLGSGLTSQDVTNEIINKFKKADVPVVVQGVDLDDISSITIDNYIGMKALVDHLIEEHCAKDFVYIAGSSDHIDSNLRLQVLKDSIVEHGYEFDNKNIVYADWERNKVEAYIKETYGDKKNKLPDAIVCANDPMAMFAILALESIGYQVPSDVKVSGFDNTNLGTKFNPSLASVDQRYREQGKLSATYALELVKDRNKIYKSVMPCTFLPGESCGCINCKNEIVIRNKLGHDVLSEKVANETFGGRIAHLEDNIMAGDEFEDIANILRKDFFTTIGREGEDFHIYLNSQYKNLVYMDENAAESEAYYSPLIDVVAARADGVVLDVKSMSSKELLLGYNGDVKGKIYVFHTLKIHNAIAGYMVMGYVDFAFADRLFETFRRHICLALDRYQNRIKITRLNKKIMITNENKNRAFAQTVLALASAVDAKDEYTHGHSRRVAEYSRQIATISGKDKITCEMIYYAALLHDVGKIGILDQILTKDGKLTDEEFMVIKQHPAIGNNILMEVSSTPELAIAAHYHHERYDGTGYPTRIKGDEIPDIARIVAVADAYDAMTSRRSYREPLAQSKVREELVNGIGSQFDPEYAKIMVDLIDNDTSYSMREQKY